jgi:hypothetical protein
MIGFAKTPLSDILETRIELFDPARGSPRGGASSCANPALLSCFVLVYRFNSHQSPWEEVNIQPKVEAQAYSAGALMLNDEYFHKIIGASE